MDADALKQEWEALEEGVKVLVGRVEELQHRCKALEEENMSLQALLRSCEDSLKSLQKHGKVRGLVDTWVGRHKEGEKGVEPVDTAEGTGALTGDAQAGQRKEYIGILDKHIASLERCIAFLKK